jgi:hypothetical protein
MTPMSDEVTLQQIQMQQVAMTAKLTQAIWFISLFGGSAVMLVAWLVYSTIVNTTTIANLQRDIAIHQQSPGHLSQASAMQDVSIKLAVIERRLTENDAKMDSISDSVRALTGQQVRK